MSVQCWRFESYKKNWAKFVKKLNQEEWLFTCLLSAVYGLFITSKSAGCTWHEVNLNQTWLDFSYLQVWPHLFSAFCSCVVVFKLVAEQLIIIVVVCSCLLRFRHSIYAQCNHSNENFNSQLLNYYPRSFVNLLL